MTGQVSLALFEEDYGNAACPRTQHCGTFMHEQRLIKADPESTWGCHGIIGGCRIAAAAIKHGWEW